MGRRYQLTWIASQRRWRKRYRKNEYFFGVKPEETKESSYRRVIVEWTRLKAQIDTADTESREARLREAWQPLLNKVREFQAGVAQADTVVNRKTWLDLERIFVDELIEPCIEEGLSPSDMHEVVPPHARVELTRWELDDDKETDIDPTKRGHRFALIRAEISP